MRIEASTLGPAVADPPQENLIHGLTESPGTTIVANSIVVGRCSGALTSEGYTLAEDPSCLSPSATDVVGVPAQLGSLGVHGGVLETYLPAAASPAIDSGDPDHCPAFDARGAPRPLDGDDDGIARCDRGAVEASCAGPDSDQDTLADPCDPCPADSANDADHDGVCESEDVCPAVPDPDQSDRDGDHFGDACDLCTDADHDGYGDPASHSCSHDEVDCDDSRAAVNPGQTEVWQNGLDDDCNPITSDTGCVPEPANAATGGAASRAGPSPSTILGWLVLALGLRTLRRARHPALRSR
ncbi:MAG: putative metal-binding motif-containing protein [bacterium]